MNQINTGRYYVERCPRDCDY